MLVPLLFLAQTSIPGSTAAVRAADEPPVRFSKPHLFAGHFAVEPRIPLAADLDGDGFADLACVYPPGGGILDVALSARGLKMHAPRDVQHGLMGEAIAGAAARGVIAWLTRDGKVCVFRDRTVSTLGTVDAPAGSMLLAVAGGWIVARPDATWRLVDAEQPGGAVLACARGPRAAAYGDTVSWIDGTVRRARLRSGQIMDLVDLGPPAGERLVAGDFDGDGRADVITGDTVRLGNGHAAFTADGLPRDGILLAADMTGDGRSDLVWCRRDADRWQGRDILVLVAYRHDSTDDDGDGLPDEREKRLGSDPLARDTDGDGIPDPWEVDGYAGFDFAAEGCTPTQKDVVCFLQRCRNADGARVHKEMQRVIATYAGLRIPIHLHVRWLPALDESEVAGKHWRELGDRGLPRELRGLAHYMITQRGGGGQSAQLGDMGGCGADALWATFLHEFGHQIGLDHTGGYPEAWCPLYTSLMNYAYSYGFDGDGNKIHYSNGALAGIELRETALHEELPFAIDKLGFLRKGPFEFRLQEAGARTRIDWNRDGVFDAAPVRADINTSYSTGGGERFHVGKSGRAPALVSHDGNALLFSVGEGGRLDRREWQTGGKWTEAVVVPAPAATGDPFALATATQTVVLVPTAAGVHVIGPDRVIPDSAGCAVSGFVHEGTVHALLWKDGVVRESVMAPEGFGAPHPFPIASTMPPGAVVAADGRLLVAAGEHQDKNRPHRWRLHELQRDSDGWKPIASRWLAGEAAGDAGDKRPNLVIDPTSGQLHWIATGRVGDGHGCFYDEVQIGDRTYRDGWLLKRYYDEWTTTRRAVAACWHGDDIVLAFTWFGGQAPEEDKLHAAMEGLGIGKQPMADFDDVAHIANFGLAHSILWLERK